MGFSPVLKNGKIKNKTARHWFAGFKGRRTGEGEACRRGFPLYPSPSIKAGMDHPKSHAINWGICPSYTCLDQGFLYLVLDCELLVKKKSLIVLLK